MAECGAIVVTTEDTDVVVISDGADVVTLTEEQQLTVISLGEQGPPGRTGLTGPGGSGAIEINFAFGDATPAVLTTVLANKIVYGVALHIRVPFDGVGAALTVGDAGDTDRLMSSDENVPALIGSNTTNPAYAYSTDTELLLSITAGAGATQGSGLATLYIQQ